MCSELAVVIHIVTHNHAATIVPCVHAALNQRGFEPGQNLLIHVTDNASTDNTLELLQVHFGDRVNLTARQTNNGFTGAHNDGAILLDEYNASYLLVLNPDVRLEPDCLLELCRVLEQDTAAGTACPKLLRANRHLEPVQPARLDSTGMFITPSFRHFDRGSQELDQGQFERHQYVFGASGAALLIRKNCLEDAAVPTPRNPGKPRLFDDAFFAYREDADLAWRLQQLGWKCRYVPSAVGYHVRKVLPDRRASLPKSLNAYSVRNRFLLQLNNFSLPANWRHIPAFMARNVMVVAAALSVERSSAKALVEACRLAPQALRRRSILRSRYRSHPQVVGRWFHFQPYAEPALSFGPSPSQAASVEIVVVNYNSGVRLGTCLSSLAKATGQLKHELDLCCTVFDNASSDGSATRVQPVFEPLKEFNFVISEKNLGFAGAINSAAANSGAETLLILNPDTTIDADALRGLINTLNQHRELGLVAPVLVDHSGRPQSKFMLRSFPTLGSTIAELFFLHRLWPSNPWTSTVQMHQDGLLRDYIERSTNVRTGPALSDAAPPLIPQPPAACVLIRRKAFQEIGGFDNRFWPAWFEDVDFCKRLADAGWLSAICGSARVAHEGGYSRKELPSSRFFEIWYANLSRYWHKHGSRFQIAVLSAVLPLALLLRSALHGATALRAWYLGTDAAKSHISVSGTLFRLAAAGRAGWPKEPS